MDKVRIQEVAEEAGMSNAALLAKAKELGFNAKVAASSITYEQAGILVEYAMSGKLPDGFKKGLLIPLYKGGWKPRSNMNSYRGITLLPVMSKLFERCISDRMNVKLHNMNNSSHLQFAGKSGSNNLLASFIVQEMIFNVTQKHRKVFAAFLDIEKCFDKIWWNG